MNTKKMERFNTLNSEALATVQGGEGGWFLPLLLTYKEILSSICGLADGLKGRKHKGSC